MFGFEGTFCLTSPLMSMEAYTKLDRLYHETEGTDLSYEKKLYCIFYLAFIHRPTENCQIF